MTPFPTEADLVIAGAGIAGAALAWHLAPHARVLLVEAEAQPGMHSTGRSAAMFMESYGPPGARALTRASRGFYTAPPDGFSEVPLTAPRGALYAAWAGQEAQLDDTEAMLRATGSPVQRLDAAAALRRAPVLRAEGLIGALWEEDALDIDVHALHQGFLRGARRAGAVLRCGAALQRAERQDGAWTLTLSDGSTLRCGGIANAAGAWADELAVRCGVAPLGLQPKRRSAFTFPAPAGSDSRGWPAVASVDDSWYFKPDAGQLLGSPANADPVPPHDVVPEELDIALGIDAIQRHTTLEIRRPARTWAGLRTFTPDGELAIGRDAAAGGFLWLAGQGGYGIQTAWAAGALAAALWRGQALPPALRQAGVEAAAMDPGRYAAR